MKSKEGQRAGLFRGACSLTYDTLKRRLRTSEWLRGSFGTLLAWFLRLGGWPSRLNDHRKRSVPTCGQTNGLIYHDKGSNFSL